MRTLAISATLILALSACGGGDDEDPAPAIADADDCAPDAEEAATVDYSSDASSLTVTADTSSLDGELNAIGIVGCVIAKLDGPSSLGERIGATRALDGAQSEEWDGFEANWSFSGADNRLLFTVDAK